MLPAAYPGRLELLHCHNAVHDVIKGHDALELGDEYKMGVQVAGKLADILLEAGPDIAYEMG